MASERFVERYWQASDGVSVYFRDYAGVDGPPRLPVVCLHGLTRNSKDFAEFAPVVASTGRRVLAVDVRGRGQSARADDPASYDPRTYARDVIGLLGASGIGQAIFVGTSMGGLISMVVALKQRALCGGIILNDVGPEVDPAGIERIKSYAGKAPVLHSWEEAGNYMAQVGGASFPDYTHADWMEFARLNHVERDGEIVVDCDPAIAVNLARRPPPSFLMWWQFRKLARRHPILVLRGAQSDILAPETAQRMANAGDNVELVTIPEVGHAPMLNETESLTAVKAFLSENR